jgi:hypothetical protein
MLRDRWIGLFSGLLAALWIWAVRNDPFFWDTIQLGSKHAHFFYENSLRWAPLPPDIDSGHPPLLGYGLAVAWTLFGKTLPVSHAFMWPWLALFIFCTLKCTRDVAGPRWAAWGAPLLLLDPVAAAQCSLISPDVILMACLLASIRGLWLDRWWTFLPVVGLCLVSTRGMMVATGLGIWWLIWLDGRRQFKRGLLHFGLAAAAGLSFLIWHHLATGWTGHAPDSTWAPAFERVHNASGILKNTAIIIWRMLDFGRVAEWVLLLIVVWNTRTVGFSRQSDKKNNQRTDGGSRLSASAILRDRTVGLFLCMSLMLLPVALIYQNLSAHRYLWPVFVGLHFLTLKCLNRTSRPVLVATLMVLSLFLGNWWVYPPPTSTGWDATLAHLPYHDLRRDAMAYFNAQKVPLHRVGTCFPAINSGEALALDGDTSSPAPLNFAKNDYVLASNVFNDLNAPQLDTLAREWQVVWSAERGLVWMRVYKRN